MKVTCDVWAAADKKSCVLSGRVMETGSNKRPIRQSFSSQIICTDYRLIKKNSDTTDFKRFSHSEMFWEKEAMVGFSFFLRA